MVDTFAARTRDDPFESDLQRLLDTLWVSNPLSGAEVETAARELLLDTLGSAISGLRDESVRRLIVALSESEPGHLHFPGSGRALSSSQYLLAFSAAVCQYEAGEGLPISHGRPGLHAVPVLLAYGLPRSRTLREILDALVVAYEVGGRLGAVFRIKPGMHVDGTWGAFASATALARLEGLNSSQTLAALNHVACQVPFSLYYPITMGSVARNLYIGHGAFLGAAAVRAAQTGFGGPSGSLVQFARLCLDIEAEKLPEELPPERSVLHLGYLKAYPCTRHMHYGIEAARKWFESDGAPAEMPDRVVLRIYSEAIKYCPNRAPTAHIQAQFSLTYGVAYSLLYGNFTLEAYDATSLADERLKELERRIIVEEDRSFLGEKRGCSLELQFGSRSQQIVIDHLPGDPGQKMTRDAIVTKFMGLTAPVLGERASGIMLEMLLRGHLDAPLVI